MKQFTLLIVLPLVMCAFLGLNSCTGFEDGPSISFKDSAKQMARTWRIKEAVLNNTDITTRFNSDFLSFEEDGEFSILDAVRTVNFPPFGRPDTLTVLGKGNWDFLDEDYRIEWNYTFFYQDSYDQTIFFQEDFYEQWTITRLTEEEFWMKNDSMSMKLEPF